MMKMKLFDLLLVFCCLFLFFGCNIARAEAANQCSVLHVQIMNNTEKTCRLIHQEVPHGSLISSPPSSIMLGGSKKFDISQTVYGPQIILTYACGKEAIQFESSQGLCVIKSGLINAKVVAHTPGIEAVSLANSGSFLFDRAGMLNWTLSSVALPPSDGDSDEA